MAKDRSNVTDSNHPDWQQYRPEGHGRTDEQIRADVHELLAKENSQQTEISLEVADGIVTLDGDLASNSPLIERIRAVPSVKSVRTRAS